MGYVLTVSEGLSLLGENAKQRVLLLFPTACQLWEVCAPSAWKATT
jgi:hypothetical protein